MAAPAPGDPWDELYAQVPDVACRGLCHESCGPVGLTVAEQRRTEQAGVRVPNAAAQLAAGLPIAHTCPALSPLRRCSVYGARPLSCRLWATVEAMPCPWGCRPAGGLLPDAEGHRLLRAAAELSRRQRGEVTP